MELTDPRLVVLLAVVALALFALVVSGFPRWRHPAARAASRGLTVIVLNAVVLAACGAALNNQYLFYSSWSDLLGSGSTQVVAHHGGSSAEIERARVTGPGFASISSPTTLPALPDPGHRMQNYTVAGARSGSRGQVLVYLPVGYDPSSTHRYPVIVGLHGFPSAPKGFVKLNFLSSIDALTAQHRMAPTIVVIPRIDTPADLDTECVNGGPGQPQTDTWLSRDIPAWTAAHFHVQLSRTSWAAVGYSYGAWCAASLTMRHPDVFGGAVSLLGYFRPDFATNYDPLSPAEVKGYDLVSIAKNDPPPVAMWVLTSHEDGLSYPTTAKFLSAARAPLDVTATVLAHGGHRVSLFTPYVPGAMAWLGQTLPGFRA